MRYLLFILCLLFVAVPAFAEDFYVRTDGSDSCNGKDIDSAADEDLDGDGVRDLTPGAPLDDDGGTDRGAVWVLFMQRVKTDLNFFGQ